MVEDGLLHLNALKKANETNNGFNGFLCFDAKDCYIKELSSEVIKENNHSYYAYYDYNSFKQVSELCYVWC